MYQMFAVRQVWEKYLANRKFIFYIYGFRTGVGYD